MNQLKLILFFIVYYISSASAEVITDEQRNRDIPIEIAYPVESKRCTVKLKCPVAFVSAGYGISHLQYSFISKLLNEKGYLVVSIGHELPSDPPLSVTGDLYKTRTENWSRGAATIDFLQQKLSHRFQAFDFDRLLLIGHSNGGDISAWLANDLVNASSVQDNVYIHSIITLDHRRVPLPKTKNIRILSIRASDFQADKGVLHSENEQEIFNSCIVNIPNAKHNDIADFGPGWLKKEISLLINHYLKGSSCNQIEWFLNKSLGSMQG